MRDWKTAVADALEARRQSPSQVDKAPFPLIGATLGADEVIAMIEVVLSGQLTMAGRVRDFEERFAAHLGAPYAVMVNSGSSANLLAVATIVNPRRSARLRPGDEVLVPAVCWSTSIAPLLQMGLKPVLVDVDCRTLNIDVESMRQKTTPRTKGLMAVHILGNCGPMDEIMTFAQDHGWIVIEDACESLGANWQGRALGTIGDLGTFSFYFSHHMTTGEGGMIVCQAGEDYDLLKCLRSHGWTREQSNRRDIEAESPDIDPRFLFIDAGYNLRPMEVQGALGLVQLAKLATMNWDRMANWHALVDALRGHPQWQEQLAFPQSLPGASPVWFGSAFTLSDCVQLSLPQYLDGLTRRGVENRPIVSGNFARQPMLDLHGCATDPHSLKGAERLHHRGFYIGALSLPRTPEQTRDLADRLLDFSP
jgi:dTDP-4-amino-4,6-dideoxygalactose transaminase